MENIAALTALGALSQETRLDAFRLLVKHEPGGLPAGEIADRLGVPQNTLSTHLGVLARAGLVTSERHSRSIVYRAGIAQLHDLTLYLVRDCCGGRPDLCDQLVAELTPFMLKEARND
jgi:ArsR family transcriptional regulator